jgi:hypothetical protein
VRILRRYANCLVPNRRMASAVNSGQRCVRNDGSLGITWATLRRGEPGPQRGRGGVNHVSIGQSSRRLLRTYRLQNPVFGRWIAAPSHFVPAGLSSGASQQPDRNGSKTIAGLAPIDRSGTGVGHNGSDVAPAHQGSRDLPGPTRSCCNALRRGCGQVNGAES